MNIRSTWMRPKTAALAVALALGLGGLGLALSGRAGTISHSRVGSCNSIEARMWLW
jgi:hypothetical protein